LTNGPILNYQGMLDGSMGSALQGQVVNGSALSGLAAGFPENRIKIRDIKAVVVEYCDITRDELVSPRGIKRSPRGAKKASFFRDIAMHLCRRLTRDSLPKIGRKFGNRHHATVLQAVRRAEQALLGSPRLRQAYAEMEDRIRARAAIRAKGGDPDPKNHHDEEPALGFVPSPPLEPARLTLDDLFLGRLDELTKIIGRLNGDPGIASIKAADVNRPEKGHPEVWAKKAVIFVAIRRLGYRQRDIRAYFGIGDKRPVSYLLADFDARLARGDDVLGLIDAYAHEGRGCRKSPSPLPGMLCS
jgi:hypothetical protein